MSQNPAQRMCPPSAPNNAVFLGQSGETYKESDPFSFRWTVTNYPELSKLTSFTSPVFQGGSKANHSWQLKLHPKQKHENVDYLGLCVQLVDYGDANDSADRVVKIDYQFSILNADGQPISSNNSYKVSGGFTKSRKWVGPLRMISSDDLIVPARKLVVNDSLKILFRGWIQEGPKHKLDDSKRAPSSKKRRILWENGLVRDIQMIYKQSIATDVTISVGNSTVKAHKAILTARSPVFAAMLNSKVVPLTITINDFDAKVVKGMLDYLYTGHPDSLPERTSELLQIADKYGLDELKKECEYVIAKRLRNANVVEILTLADKHNASFLKSRAVDFIKLNKRELSQMKSFQDAVRANSAGGLFAELFLLM